MQKILVKAAIAVATVLFTELTKTVAKKFA